MPESGIRVRAQLKASVDEDLGVSPGGDAPEQDEEAG